MLIPIPISEIAAHQNQCKSHKYLQFGLQLHAVKFIEEIKERRQQIFLCPAIFAFTNVVLANVINKIVKSSSLQLE